MMWPILLDMTKEESMQHLRCLEIDAFSGLVSALRAQGGLDHEKLKILKDTGSILHISQDRHKAEVRRVVNDERLNTIAYHVNGEKYSADEWAEEGQRLIPLIARVAPQTAYSAIADEVADSANKLNKQLPSPSLTERKRPSSISPTHSNASTSDSCSKSLQFRLSEPDMKKRKLSLENSNLAQHLMGPPKISKIQQIYRQKTKARQKEQLMKLKPQDLDKSEYMHIQQVTLAKPHQQVVAQSAKVQPKLSVNQIATAVQNSPKINILQNISIHAPVQNACDEQKVESNAITEDTKDSTSQPGCSNDNQVNKLMNKVLSNTTLNKVNQLTIKSSGTSDIQKTIKVCAPRKTVTSKTVTTSSGQKLIVVSNPQTLTSTSSILQRTLTTIPFKNISVKNFDKFKIVTSTSSSPQQPPVAAPIQIQNSKQKVVTVRTTSNKKMIPFSQVQVLNTKGGIKVLPLGGKIISKSNATANSVYFVNTISGEGSGTKSTTSTPVLMSCKPQENSPIAAAACEAEAADASQESTNVPLDSENICFEEDKAELVGAVDKSQVCSPITVFAPSECNQNSEVVLDEDCVTVTTKYEDVEPSGIEESVITSEEISEDNVVDNINVGKIVNDTNSFYVIDGEHTNDDVVIDDLQISQPLEVLNIVGSLDPITGQYSMNENEQENEAVVESHILEVETPEADLNAIN